MDERKRGRDLQTDANQIIALMPSTMTSDIPQTPSSISSSAIPNPKSSVSMDSQSTNSSWTDGTWYLAEWGIFTHDKLSFNC